MGEYNQEKTMASGNNKNVMFFVPLIFAIQTRFLRRSRLGLIIWATEYLIPVLLSLFIMKWSLYDIVTGLLAIIAVYNLYEIGYIQNDCETIKKEDRPTKRLTVKQLKYYEEHKSFIYGVRMLWGVFFSWYFMEKGLSWIWIAAMWMVIPYYLVYNYLRGRICLYLIMPLTTYRYCFPLIIYGMILESSLVWIVAFTLYIAYPLSTFIEICSDGKGNPPETWTRLFLRNFDDRFRFRVWYYLLMSMMCFSFCAIGDIPYSITLIPLFYLLDRIPQLKMKKLNVK